MTQHMARQLVKELVKNKFPELRYRWIRVIFVSGGFYMAVASLPFFTRLEIDEEMLTYSRQAFTGCLAHELSHVVLRHGSLRNRWKQAAGELSASDMERAADTMVVERGLGQELLQFHKEHNREYESFKADEGLTTWEIKAMLKHIVP